MFYCIKSTQISHLYTGRRKKKNLSTNVEYIVIKFDFRPPTDCNVFCEAEQLTMIPMLNDHHQKLQQKIRQMLLEVRKVFTTI